MHSGNQMQGEVHSFRLHNCPLCQAPIDEFRAVFKPPTAGIRILSIDGGGIRGVIPLAALKRIQLAFTQTTGIKGPIQNHFDLALGTSSGTAPFHLVESKYGDRECRMVIPSLLTRRVLILHPALGILLSIRKSC